MSDDGEIVGTGMEDVCAVIPPDGTRLIIVAIVGNGIAIFSLLFNGGLFVLLVASEQSRRTHLIYLIFMSFIDVFLSAAYIALFPVSFRYIYCK